VIRCTIQLLPGGDESRARTIGLVEIANTAVLDGNFGEYVVVLKKTPPFSGALKSAWRRGRLVASETQIAGVLFREGDGDYSEDDEAILAEISDHHRTKRGVYDLLYRALKACGLEARCPADKPAKAVGELL
jgi:hypothetical protein